jgi:hypothetical protein
MFPSWVCCWSGGWLSGNIFKNWNAFMFVYNQERVHLKQSDPCGILYITIGDGGNIEGLARMQVFITPLHWKLECHKIIKRSTSLNHNNTFARDCTHCPMIVKILNRLL